MKYTIYDNGGKTVDRYTMRLQDNDVWGFNETPFHPQGFGQYGGAIERMRSYKHLGKRIDKAALPEQARQFVTQVLQSLTES